MLDGSIIPIKRIEPYYKIALKAAKDSPCVRRKYGAVIGYTDTIIIGVNLRVTKACDNGCIRNRAGVTHGDRSDLGAEVHAEQVALIESQGKGLIFVIAGLDSDGKELTGVQAYPCLTCARMIKYAGYRWVHVKEKRSEQLVAVHIEDIIQYREEELGPHYE